MSSAASIRTTWSSNITSSSNTSTHESTHEERTSHEWRSPELHTVVLRDVMLINDDTRMFNLAIQDKERGMKFLPGQWLDVHIPELDSPPGGYSITTTPTQAAPKVTRRGSRLHYGEPSFDLAIQRSPKCRVARWLWQERDSILGKELQVRVGGSFVWPPPNVDLRIIEHAVFVAGGVGINPLMSMLRHLHRTKTLPHFVTVLYGTRATEPDLPLELDRVLFLPQLLRIASRARPGQVTTRLFVTGLGDRAITVQDNVPEHAELLRSVALSCSPRRMGFGDVGRALGAPEARRRVVVYVCGPRAMAEDVVGFVESLEGMCERRVFYERWW